MHGIAAITGNMHHSLRYFVLLEHVTSLYICLDVCMSFCTLTLRIFVFARRSTPVQNTKRHTYVHTYIQISKHPQFSIVLPCKILARYARWPIIIFNFCVNWSQKWMPGIIGYAKTVKRKDIEEVVKNLSDCNFFLSTLVVLQNLVCIFFIQLIKMSEKSCTYFSSFFVLYPREVNSVLILHLCLQSLM